MNIRTVTENGRVSVVATTATGRRYSKLIGTARPISVLTPTGYARHITRDLADLQAEARALAYRLEHDREQVRSWVEISR